MYFIESEICIGGCFLEGCFHYYSQQVTSDVANETLIPCNPAANTVTANVKPSQIKKM